MTELSFGKVSRKEKLNQFIYEKAVPFMGKVGNQRYLASIRDGFAVITPMIIAAAIAMIILTSIFGGWGAEKSSVLGVIAQWVEKGKGKDGSSFSNQDGVLNTWGKISDEITRVLGSVNQFGIGLITIYFTYGFGYFLCKTRGNTFPELGGLIALGAFFVATFGGASSANYIAFDGTTKPLSGSYMGANGIFSTLIVTIAVSELYCFLCNVKALTFNMPAGVPPAVARSFTKLFPVIITALAVGGVLAIVAIPTHLTQAGMLAVQQVGNETTVGIVQGAKGSFYNIGDLFYMAIQAPFIYAASVQSANFGIAVLYTFLVGFFWSFGVHGTNIANGIFNPIWLVLLAKNQALAQTSISELNSHGSIFVAGTFDAYIFWGGTGETLTLVLCSILLSKKVSEKEVAKFALPATIFNINEPVLFGYPLVANPIYIIPLWFLMPIVTVTTYIFSLLFQTTPVYVLFPWTTPLGVGALLATGFDWTSFIIVIINFVIGFLVWMPFVLISSKAYLNSVKKEEMALKQKQANSDNIAIKAE